MQLIKEYYIGIVVDNKDPDGKGRIKIRVPDLYTNVEDRLLPYAIPNRSSEDIPNIGDKIWVWKGGTEISPIWFYEDKLNWEEYTNFLKQIPLTEKKFPEFKVIKIGGLTDIVIGITDSKDTPEVLIFHPKSYIYINKNGEIRIQSTNTIQIKANDIKLEGSKIEMKNVSATPNGQGVFCGIKNCLFTGSPHTSDTALGN